MKKYKSVIEKVVVTDATFKNSTANNFEPTWINYFYGNNGTGKSESDYVIREELKFVDDDPTMPGVITLGEEYINAQQEVDAKTTERNNLTAQIETDTTELEKSRSSQTTKKAKFEDALWKSRGQELKKIFGGGGDFRSKDAFASKVRATKPAERNQ